MPLLRGPPSVGDEMGKRDKTTGVDELRGALRASEFLEFEIEIET